MESVSQESRSLIAAAYYRARVRARTRTRARKRDLITYNKGVRIITTHLSADFDAFAAAVCAVRLYPDHKVLFPGSHEAAVRRFIADTGLPYPELKLRQARRETI